MIKKLRITEEQYDRLKNYLNETPFGNVVYNLKRGDMIRLNYRNTPLIFTVINSTQGQIDMVGVSGTEHGAYMYHFAQSDLDGNVLYCTRKYIGKNPNTPKDSTKYPFRDVKNIEVIRNNKVIDRVDKPEAKVQGQAPVNKSAATSKLDTRPTPEDIDKFKDIKNEILKAKEAHIIDFDLADGTKIKFCSLGITGHGQSRTIGLELYSIDGDEKKYAKLRHIQIQIRFNNDFEQDINDDIFTKEGNKTILSFKIGQGEFLTERYSLEITKVQAGGPCKEEGKEEDDAANEKAKEESEKAKAEANNVYQAIMNDKKLEKAFYSQPSLWDRFIAELRGKKAVGKGIITVKSIVNTYEKKKVKNYLSTILKEGQSYKYEFTNQYVFKVGGKEFPGANIRKEYIGTYQLDSDGQSILRSNDYDLLIMKVLLEKKPIEFECKVRYNDEESRVVNMKLIQTK